MQSVDDDGEVALADFGAALGVALADVSIYWFTRTAGSSANLYYEAMHGKDWPRCPGGYAALVAGGGWLCRACPRGP